MKFNKLSLIIFIVLVLGILSFSATKLVPQSTDTKPETNILQLLGSTDIIIPAPKPEFKNLAIKKEALTTYSLKSLGNDTIQLGTEKTSPSPTQKPISKINLPFIKVAYASQDQPAKPYLKLNKWDNEVSLKVSIPFDVVSETPDTSGGKLTYQTVDNKKIEFLAKAPEEITEKDSLGNEHKYTINEEGGVEFNTILEEKPISNQLTFPIETQGLDFFYQPPLNEENTDPKLTCTQTECRDKDGNIVNFRPEQVVGSYAVYYKDGKSGDYSKMGGKNYKAGKAFHIYRPKVWDSAGKQIYGNLAIEQSNNLTITIPQSFLDSASYPVTIDPNFGYETAGTTGTANLNDAISGSYFSMPENGIATSMATSIYLASGCFSEDTLITMANGSFKKIKDIRVNDEVKSYNSESLKYAEEKVTKIFYHPANQMGNYYLLVKTNNGKSVKITPNHPVYANKKWVQAGELKNGDLLLTDKEIITVTSIKKIYQQIPTYNLEVSNNHTYFANFLVHNKASLLTDTKLMMNDGLTKDIQEVVTGDEVKSYNFQTRRIETGKVVETVSSKTQKYILITSFLKDPLKITPNHPIFINNQWKLAKEVKNGDLLISQTGVSIVNSIVTIYDDSEVFDLTVIPHHNFYANSHLVSDNSSLTHSGELSPSTEVLVVDIKGNNLLKKIDQIRIGDKIVTFNAQTKKQETGLVTNFQIDDQSKELFIINNSLKIAPNATVYTVDGKKLAKDLQIHDQLISDYDGKTVPVVTITKEDSTLTYSINVSGNHNFFANGLLVHNALAYFKTAIYRQSDNVFMVGSGENSFNPPQSKHWEITTISTSVDLTSGTNYWLYGWGDNLNVSGYGVYYDSGGNGVNKTVTYSTWPDPLTGTTSDSRKYSIYATYTPAPPPQVNLKGGINLKGGTKLGK